MAVATVVVGCRTTCLPLRSTATSAVSSPLARISFCACGQVVICGAVDRDDRVAGQEPGRLGRGLRVGGGAGTLRLVDVGLGHGDDALRDTADRGGRLRDAVAHEDDREQEEGEHQVDGHPGAHDDDPLPPGLVVEEPVVVLGADVLVLRRAGVADQLGEHARVAAARRVSGSSSGSGGTIPTSLQ